MNEKADLEYPENHKSKKIQLATPAEVEDGVRTYFNPKSAPGFHLITATILKKLLGKAIVIPTKFSNSAFRFEYITDISEVAEV